MIRPFYYSNRSPYFNNPFIVEEWIYVDNKIFKYANGPCWVSNIGRVYNQKLKINS